MVVPVDSCSRLLQSSVNSQIVDVSFSILLLFTVLIHFHMKYQLAEHIWRKKLDVHKIHGIPMIEFSHLQRYGNRNRNVSYRGKINVCLFSALCICLRVFQGIDVKSMGRIFVGLVKCGAWGCFDEFNRLEEAVLSAVSMQIQAIQHSLKHHKHACELLGKEVRIKEQMQTHTYFCRHWCQETHFFCHDFIVMMSFCPS